MAFGDKVNMANPIVVKEEQQIRVAEQFPLLAYSRVFGLFCQLSAGVGNDDYAMSGPVGNRAWLLGVRCQFMPQALNEASGCLLYICYGQNPKAGAEEIATRWELVVECKGGAKKAIYWTVEPRELYLPMKRLFTGQSLRFGVVAENLSDVVGLNVNVFFEVSEG